MIGAIAALFLGAAGIADISNRDQSRMMLGQWRELFEERGHVWALDFVTHAVKSTKKNVFRKIHDLFNDWFTDSFIVREPTSRKALDKAISLLNGRTIFVNSTGHYPEKVIDKSLVECKITNVKLANLEGPSWAPSPPPEGVNAIQLLLKVEPVDSSILLGWELTRGPWILFGEETS